MEPEIMSEITPMDDYVDAWAVRLGPDDTHIEITQNGAMVARSRIKDENNRYGEFKAAVAWLEWRATVGDEIVLHFSGRI